MKDYVYVIEFGERLVKVGKSIHPDRRIKNVSSSSGREKMRTWVSPPLMNAYTLEGLTHDALSEHRGHGEWFDCSFEVAVSCSNKLLTDEMLWTQEKYDSQKARSSERMDKVLTDLFGMSVRGPIDLKQRFHEDLKRALLERAVKNYMVFLEIDSRREDVFFNAWIALQGKLKDLDGLPQHVVEEMHYLRALASDEYIRAAMVSETYMGHVTEDCMMIAQDVSKIPEMVDMVEEMAKERLANGEKAPL